MRDPIVVDIMNGVVEGATISSNLPSLGIELSEVSDAHSVESER